MQEKQKEIQNCNALIKMSCVLLEVRLPQIYYISNDNTMTLWDDQFHFISNHPHDIGYHGKTTLFLLKEYTLYIHINILKNPIYAYTLILRQTRAIYQYKQVFSYKQKKNYNQSVPVTQWLYEFENAYNNEYNPITPVEIDKNAYSCVIMTYLFDKTPSYDMKFNEHNIISPLDEHIHELKKQYDILQVWQLASQNQLVCTNLKRIHLKYMQ